ncbi:BaiN/RdsA family NAD(P)/FAD-dependent oxidoreductase [Candidatus Bandiella numerosa]|uniref:NAD(P)/FAD-dependent oxidoreductase n=1 Tax=Candidatus Bandiella numerosa TaxID=2570586 RepID=UPI001F30317F
MNTVKYDVIVVGAGAAGLMAASTAGKRGRKVLLIEHTHKIGEKIRISGGGRCNFTNLNASPKNYLSENPCFMISALARYTQYDFIKLVESYSIAYHEKTLGQLFCDGSAIQIINMLITECKIHNVTLLLNNSISVITKNDEFYLKTSHGIFQAQSLIIASGGLSIPKLGASNFGYQVAKQFGLQIVTPRPALVPLTVAESDLGVFKDLSGVSIPCIVSNKKIRFRENILFTHRGLSGPAILQISSYLEQPKQAEITINLLPEIDIRELFITNKNNKSLLSNFLKEHLPKSFVDNLSLTYAFDKRIVDYKSIALEKIAFFLHNFIVKIDNTEGYMKAEVTAGGVNTNELSSKTMEASKVPGLFFIGEVVDVTGWLGGYNFQWAWSSGYVAGLYA